MLEGLVILTSVNVTDDLICFPKVRGGREPTSSVLLIAKVCACASKHRYHFYLKVM